MTILQDAPAELDAPTPVRTRPPRRPTDLPWTLFGLALAALVLALATRPEPALPELRQLGLDAPAGVEAISALGQTNGADTFYDANGALTALVLVVRPVAQEYVSCTVSIEGQQVHDEGVNGMPAVCSWKRLT